MRSTSKPPPCVLLLIDREDDVPPGLSGLLEKLRQTLETARLVAEHVQLPFEIRPGIGENDRSSLGFVAPAEFEALADAFLRSPSRASAAGSAASTLSAASRIGPAWPSFTFWS